MDINQQILKKYRQELNKLDYKIVRLFEQRMCTVKQITEFHIKHDLLPKEPKHHRHDIVDKTTSLACDTEVVAYTEGLVTYILTASEKFAHNIKKQND